MTSADFSGGNPDVLYGKDDHKRVKNLFDMPIILMASLGQYPQQFRAYLPKFFGPLGFVLTYLYSGFFITLFFFFTTFQLKTLYNVVMSDMVLEDLSDAITMVLIYTVSGFTTVYVIFRLKMLLNIFNYFNKNYCHHSLAGLTFVSSYELYRKVRKLALFWFTSAFFGGSIWIIPPMFSKTRTLPLKSWHPYDVMQPIVYEIHYVLQFLGQVTSATTFAVVSGLFLSLVILLLSQFDMLYCSLKNLSHHAYLLNGADLHLLQKMQNNLPKSEEVQQYMVLEEFKTDLKVFFNSSNNRNKDYKAALHASLVECVRLHRFLSECCKMLEDFFNPYCLVIALQTRIQMCTLVFAATIGDPSMMRIFNNIQYFVLTLANLAIFCYCGELLSQHSVRSNQSFWRSQWTIFDVNAIRKDMLMFLMCSSKIVTITAGKFFSVDLGQLRLAVTQAFSFYTLLQTIAAKRSE